MKIFIYLYRKVPTTTYHLPPATRGVIVAHVTQPKLNPYTPYIKLKNPWR